MPNWLDIGAAETTAGMTGDVMTSFEKWLRDNYPTLFVIEGKEASARFTTQFAKPGLRSFVHRISGGCGHLESRYWPGLNVLMRVLGGYSETGLVLPRMSGLGICGGDRMLYKADPKVIRPGVTEIFPAIGADCPKALLVGLIVRYSKMYPTEYGLVVGSDDADDYFTVMHPGHKALALLQENADEICPRSAEFLRCSDIFGELQEQGWQSLLTVYNGGAGTQDEIEHWCKLAKRSRNPELWRILLVSGSGGMADRYAQDSAFLSNNPNVHVAECSEQALRDAYVKLDAITVPR